MYVVIMAGGPGTRLWPMSRQEKPKLFFNLISEHSLIQDTIDRFLRITPKEKIFISTNKKYIPLSKKQVKSIPFANIVGEPAHRDTSSCIGLMTILINHYHPNAVIGIFPSDHYIEKEDKFLKIVQSAEKLVSRENKTVILGIKPTYPAIEYGYINISKELKSISGHKVYQVNRFVEKPDTKTAQKYIKTGKYFWNAGMFFYPAKKMIQAFKKYMPESYKYLMKIQDKLGTKDENKAIEAYYPKLEKISIDYGIIEKLDDLLMIPADIGWNDIGNWSSLKDVISSDIEANVTRGNHIGVDTSGSLIYASKKPIATFGVKDMIVVDTDDIILICPKNKAADIKKMTNFLKDQNKSEYL